MQKITSFFKYYVLSNLHVAIAGFCITKITLVKSGNLSDLAPLFVALSIVISYNFIRFYEVEKDKVVWLKQWFFSNRNSLILLSFLSVLLLNYLLFFTNFNKKSLLVLVPFAFMTLFYVVPLFRIGDIEISFRNFPGIKIFSIAISWAGISVLFPLVEQQIHLEKTHWIELVQRFLLLIVIIIPFDIRDCTSDFKELKTLPQIFGVRNVKIIAYILLLVFILLEFFKDFNEISEKIVTILIALITAFFVRFSKIENSRMYSAFWVESIPIIWLGLIVLFL